jgi:hypothetical protein
MKAVQVKVRQKNSQDAEVDEVLGADNEFEPGLHGWSHALLSVLQIDKR